MSDRSFVNGESRPNRRGIPGSKSSSRRRMGHRPAVEPLEGRALMSVGGTPDYTYGVGNLAFSNKGLASVPFYQGTDYAAENLVQGEAIQADGKLVVVGFEDYTTSYTYGSSKSIISVARLNSDGTVDTAFGTRGSVNLPDPTAGTLEFDQGTAVAIQPDGKILVLGDLSPNNPVGGGGPIGTNEVALTRLNSDGSIDTTFGTAGTVDFFFKDGTTTESSTASNLAVDANGKILVGGLALNSGAALARFNADGTPDTSFNTTGQLPINITSGSTTLADSQGVAGLAIRSDGEIVLDTTVTSGVGASLVSQVAAVTLHDDGTPDTTFGTDGQLLVAGSTGDTAGPLTIQPDGKLVLSAAYLNATNLFTTYTSRFDAFRLSPAGVPDATFGTDGEASLDTLTRTAPAGSDAVQAVARALVVQPDGKIVEGGSVTFGNSGFLTTPTLVRFNADGSADLTFGSGGVIGLDYLGGGYDPNNVVPHSFFGLAVGANGQVLAATNIGVARLLTTGAPNDFDNDGKTDPAIYIPSLNLIAYRPSSGGADVQFAYGTIGSGNTLPTPGAYNPGDYYNGSSGGIDNVAVYLPNLGVFSVRGNNTAGTAYDTYTALGTPGLGNAIPVPADYDGSGSSELGVYLPSTGSFSYLSPSQTAPVTVPFGTPGAGNTIPVPADYDGSGHDELGVYIPAVGAFAYRPADGGPDVDIPFGTPGAGNSIPVPGDYDGSGHTELAVYLPALGAFAYRPYGGGPDVIVPFGTPGVGGSLPAPGDYDGSGHLELGVYLPALGAFAYRPADGGTTHDVIESFGLPGAGLSIPFESISATDGAFDTSSGGGGGGSAAGLASGGGSGSYLDFVPDLAGQKKGKGSNSGQAGA